MLTLNDVKILNALDRMKKSGRYMIAMWHIEDGGINVFSCAQDFPRDQIEQSVCRLLKEASQKPNDVIIH